MDEQWDMLIRQVKTEETTYASLRSELNGLVLIFDYAREHKLIPSSNLGQRISALREIIPEGRKAIKREDTSRLQELLDLAAEKTIRDIRLILGKPDLVDIHVTELSVDNNKRFAVELTEYQLERIEKSTDQFFKFIREGAE